METHVLDRPPEPPEAMPPPPLLADVMDGMAMTITDQELANAMKVGYQRDQEKNTGDHPNLWYSAARTARRLLLPPSPDELRMERGKAACEAISKPHVWGMISKDAREEWCRVADAVLEKKAEQDGDA